MLELDDESFAGEGVVGFPSSSDEAVLVCFPVDVPVRFSGVAGVATALGSLQNCQRAVYGQEEGLLRGPRSRKVALLLGETTEILLKREEKGKDEEKKTYNGNFSSKVGSGLSSSSSSSSSGSELKFVNLRRRKRR